MVGIVRLPNGHNLTVTPVFGGLYFKSVEEHNTNSPFPPGWTIIINTEDDEEAPSHAQDDVEPLDPYNPAPKRRRYIHTYRKPTLQNDHLFFSSIRNPATNDSNPTRFPASSPTRQIAMMLWATLFWYFHQEEPEAQMTTPASSQTVPAGRPKGEWRLNINREGIFKGRQLMQKLEHMGLIATEDSSVGTSLDPNTSEGWSDMFVARRHFWQLDPRTYLFTLSPQVNLNSPFPGASPAASRPDSPALGYKADAVIDTASAAPTGVNTGLWQPPGQFKSSSHLPTFYPPAPAQYVFTNNIRHPIRPKPPRQGETFYTRFIPSLGEYLSFRVASLSKRPVQHVGPVAKPQPSPPTGGPSIPNGASPLRNITGASDSEVPTIGTLNLEHSDSEMLNKWMNEPRVAYSWGEDGPLDHQEKFLENNLKSKHSFPVIACFDGKPFAYFEIYWVKEDKLGSYLGGNVSDWDRGVSLSTKHQSDSRHLFEANEYLGIHVLVGEQKFRGPHRIKVWLSALVHCCFLADSRTECVMLEPRVDNEK